MIGLAAVLLAASPAPILLWDNVPSGMPVAEFRQLYPAAKIDLERRPDVPIGVTSVVADCPAIAVVGFSKGVVDEVSLYGQGQLTGDCFRKVRKALTAELGKPGWSARAHVWRRGETELQLRDSSDYVRDNGGLMEGSSVTRGWWLRIRAADAE